jgi:hypothetical protein
LLICKALAMKARKQDHATPMDPVQRVQLEQIAAKRSKKKSKNPNGTIDFVSIFLSLLVVLISVFTLPLDWSIVSTQHVWYYGWITAVSTGVGVLPFFFFSEPDKFWMGISNGKINSPVVSGATLYF